MHSRIWVFIKQNKLLCLALVVLFIGRIIIGGQGYLEDSDEIDFYASERAFDALKSFDIIAFSEAISTTQGKTSETIIKSFLVPFHRLWAAIGGHRIHSTGGLWFFGIFNTVVSIAILLTFHFLLTRLAIHKTLAVVGVFCLGVLINFTLYTRHILPYDMGLLIHMFALLVALNTEYTDKKKYTLLGFLCALGFTIYHGYFMFLFIIGAFLFWQMKDKQMLRKHFGVFVRAFIVLPLVYEVLFWFSGNSFIIENIKIGGTISQGTYAEGFMYAGLYLGQIEGLLGGLILIAFLIAVGFAFGRKQKSETEQLILLAFSAYLIYAFTVNVLMKFVFYGRIFHMYIPFFVLGLMYLLNKFPLSKTKWFAAASIGILSIQFILNINYLNSFTYPRKVIEDYALADLEREPDIEFIYELDYTENHQIGPERIFDLDQNILGQGSFLAGNTCFFKHHPDRFIESYLPADLSNSKVIFTKPHFQSQACYTFEYCSKVGRKFYLEKAFQIFIVKKE